MRRWVLFSGLGIAALFLLHGVMNSAGAPPGYTGAPADGGKTCATSPCHTGAAPVDMPGMITFFEDTANLGTPSTQYVPGQRGRIVLSLNAPGVRGGFEIAIFDTANQPVGTFHSVQGFPSQPAGGNPNYYTHQGAYAFVNNTFITMVDWTPPTNNVGPVTIYAVINAANGNGLPSGDTIYKSSLILQPKVSSSAIPKNPIEPKIYWTSSYLQVQNPWDKAQLSIYNLQGQQLLQITLSKGIHTIPMDANHQIWIVRLQSGTKVFYRKILAVQ